MGRPNNSNSPQTNQFTSKTLLAILSSMLALAKQNTYNFPTLKKVEYYEKSVLKVVKVIGRKL
jgi:hypothetical protein